MVKLGLLAIASGAGAQEVDTTSTPPKTFVKSQRRFKDFKAMFLHFFTHEQLTSIYGYGCYCLNLGDRPLSGMMTGVEPVDDVDELCFQWTKCNRCTTFDHGDQCTPETVKYNFKIGKADTITCTDAPGTCKYNICECDRWSVMNLQKVVGSKQIIDTTDDRYLAHKGFIAENQCRNKVRSNRGPMKMNCCGEYPKRFPFNENARQCCNGRVTSTNECVDSSFN